MGVRVLSPEELFELDLEGEEASEGFYLSSLKDAFDLFKANYIDLRTLDRIKGGIANWKYNYPKGTEMSMLLLRNKKGYWMTYSKIYVPGGLR